MQIAVFSGFLGSGKTSLLLPFAKHLTAQGRKVAIIENEIGENGIDDQYLREHGLFVTEIYHGCICCSLRTDLVSALIKLEREYKPDVIIMEPTGVADPYLTLSSLSGFPGYVESKIMVSVVDAERFEDIADLHISLATDGVKAADIIALNKIDLAAPDHIERITSTLTQINPDSEIKNVSILDDQLQAELFALIESNMFSTQIKEAEQRIVLEKKGISPTVSSKQFIFTKDQICLSELETKKYFEDRVYRIAVLLNDAGADLIGNLKLIITSDRDGYLLISTTSFTRYPEVSGRLPAGYEKVEFNINAMVYGVEQSLLESIIEQVFPH